MTETEFPLADRRVVDRIGGDTILHHALLTRLIALLIRKGIFTEADLTEMQESVLMGTNAVAESGETSRQVGADRIAHSLNDMLNLARLAGAYSPPRTEGSSP